MSLNSPIVLPLYIRTFASHRLPELFDQRWMILNQPDLASRMSAQIFGFDLAAIETPIDPGSFHADLLR